MPPIVRNKVASAASRPASQTRRFESTLLMSPAASAAGASASANVAVSASASVSFLFISSFPGRRLARAVGASAATALSRLLRFRVDPVDAGRADYPSTRERSFCAPIRHTRITEVKQQSPLRSLQTDAQNVVSQALLGRDLGQRAVLDPRFEDDPRLKLRDRSGRDRLDHYARDIGALIRSGCWHLRVRVAASAAPTL